MSAFVKGDANCKDCIRNAQNHLRIDGPFNDNFLVQVGLCQSSLLVLCYLSLCWGHDLEKSGQDVQENCF